MQCMGSPVLMGFRGQAQGNLFLTFMNIAVNVSASMPQEMVGNAIAEFNSDLLDISLIKEVAGAVEILEVSRLGELPSFRVKESAPLEGDQCVFFDFALKKWSPDGVSLADNTAGQITGIADTGTWCQASHFSIFAVVQTVQSVPFNLLLDTSDWYLNRDIYAAALAITLITACLVCGLLGLV